MGHSNHVLDGGPGPPTETGNFGVGMDRPIIKYKELEPSAAKKTAGSIEMAFGVWGVVCPSNHVLTLILQ